MIQNLIFIILFLKILFRACNFIPHVPVDIIRVFIIPEFVVENLKVNKNQRKKITHFIMQFCSRNLTHFTNLNSFEMKIICLQNTAKKHPQFTNFPANMFLFGVTKNICPAPFPDTQELLS